LYFGLERHSANNKTRYEYNAYDPKGDLETRSGCETDKAKRK